MESAVRSSMRLKLCVPGGPDINMRALAVLVTQPFDCLLDLDGALPFPENHLAGVAPDAKIKALAAHRAKLGAHQPLYDHGRFLASILTLLLGHRVPSSSYGRRRSVMRMARSTFQLLVNTGSSRSCSPQRPSRQQATQILLPGCRLLGPCNSIRRPHNSQFHGSIPGCL